MYVPTWVDHTRQIFVLRQTIIGQYFSDNILLFMLNGFKEKVCKLSINTWVARFFMVQRTKTGKIYQMTSKHTTWPYNRPNGLKIHQYLLLQDDPKFTEIGIFGLKIYHLATLINTVNLIVGTLRLDFQKPLIFSSLPSM
jgi:hypothetical protein